MPKIIEGKIVAKGMKFGIVASRFNDFLCGRLSEGAVDALMRAGAEEKDIVIYKAFRVYKRRGIQGHCLRWSRNRSSCGFRRADDGYH
jgi:hypothetical protein